MDPWEKFQLVLLEKQIVHNFNVFQNIIRKETWENHDKIFNWAESSQINDNSNQENEYLELENCIEKEGYLLKKKVEKTYFNCYENVKGIKILIHVPPSDFSPGGNSLFSNMVESLNFIGIPSKAFQWNDNLYKILSDFRPTIFLTSDHFSYLNRLDWDGISNYKKKFGLKIGLTASLEEQGNSPLLDRLALAEKRHIDFYYCFHNPDYIKEQNKYDLFYKKGYTIYSIEFGANPLHYYPLPHASRDLDFVFLASSNPDKWDRYFTYLPRIFVQYPGFIHGPGWRIDNKKPFNPDRDRYIYSRGKAGINLHINESIKYPNELNERTYMLAACGIPQLVDNAKLITQYFGSDCCYIGKNPKEYYELFVYILENPGESEKRALNAIKKVFNNYTTFKRAESFIQQLSKNVIS